MITLRKGYIKANASLISMMQRFSDITIIIFSLYLVCLFNASRFVYVHWLLVLGGLVIFQMLGGITDFYRFWRGVNLSSELALVIQNWTLSLILMAGIISFFEMIDVNFRTYLQWYILVTLGLIICRTSIRFIIGIVRHLGYNTCRVAIAGVMPVGINLAKSFAEAPWLGFQVVGIYNNTPLKGDEGVVHAGDFKKLVSDAREGTLDRIYISMPMSEEQSIKAVVSELTDTTCSVMLIPDVFTFNILQSRNEEVNGVAVISLFDTPMSGINMILKRLEDFFMALAVLLLILPILVVIALLVKFTSPGPVIFRQIRYGMDGKPIKVWKFRSMSVMENGEKVVQAKKGDTRVTPIGSILRRTSLDELPQFINVLMGDMSIVGPRPHAVAHNEQYRSLIKGYMLRHKVKPGITGWAQINGWRGETDTLDKMRMRVEYDLEYIRDWSIWFDIKIIFLTIFKGFISKTAY